MGVKGKVLLQLF